MHLIVGLGNPGPEYEGTRHNVGFAVVDLLAVRHGLSLGRKRFDCLVGRGRIAGREAMVAKPQTYMNLSGLAVRAIAEYFRVESDEIVVVHDDLDLELGGLKITARGGSGGNKGVQSIIDSLGSKDFPRVRIGIGRPPSAKAGADYVLGRCGPEEAELMEKVLVSAAEAVETIVSEGVSKAQLRFNTKVRSV